MQKLTPEIKRENKWTLLQAVNFFDVELTPKECEEILWNHTQYPGGTVDKIIGELNKFFKTTE